MYFKKYWVVSLLFTVSLTLFSCGAHRESSDTTKKGFSNSKGCTVCKAPSRSTIIKASLHNDSSISHGSDTGRMVLLKGGSFQMGSNDYPDAKPIHKVQVSSFFIDVHEVTNDQFEKFVRETNYVSVAERPLNPKDYPDVPIEKLVPGSGVFTPPDHPVDKNNPMNWWTYVAGANWRHPKGPGSNIIGKGNYPVVQLCYEDCLAYSKWAGKSLPTEAQWEFAAKAGHNFPTYYWGNEKTPGNKYMANNFQGEFPFHNTKKDGFTGLAPIESFPPNDFGLYDMEGNAWEWCQDYYRADYYSKSPHLNPTGPKDSFDPEEPNAVKRVQRGGSFLCSDDYCLRYKTGARGKGEVSSASDNLGFRCVKTGE